MSESPQAVFLSYAREDAGAARRIADALRSSGLEVWFDENELRGGDAWDAKIRHQIDACTLFVPLISTHTQGRSKGYFRLEWKLAVDQTHLLAEGVPFVAPVAIDDTPESGALVPAEFLKVQWTRLPGALPTPEFVTQVKRLLSRQRPAAAGTHAGGGFHPSTISPVTSAPAKKSGMPAWIWAAVAAAVVGVALVVLRRPAATPPNSPPPASTLPAANAPAVVAPPSAAANEKSIAVLPFENMSEEKDASAFFADGVHEDILTNLSFVRDLHVVSRTSVMQYRNTTKPISQIARELNVAYILEGSVRRAGNKVRVTGQLIHAATDEHVWAKAYDRDVTDVFAIQAELAQAIAGALQAAISPAEKSLLERKPTENPAAYDLYLKARQRQSRGGYSDEEGVIALLDQAVELDPNFAEAWAMLGARHAFAYFNRDRSPSRLAQAKTAIETAIHLAPNDPAVIEAGGDYYYYGYRDYARATEQYEKLAQLRPNDESVFASLAYIHRRQGQARESLADFRRALELDPDNGRETAEYINTLMGCRLYDDALVVGNRYLQKHPDHLFIAAGVAEVDYAAHGSTDKFRAFAQRTVPPENQAEFLYIRQLNARLLGDWAEAIRLDHEQRYFDADTDTPRWMQDVLAAATLAEAGDTSAARSRAGEAVVVMNAELARQPLSAILWASLSLGHALLGEKDEALRCGDKAREILPESHDAIQGSNVAILRASALAYAGEKDQALAEFERLLHVPFGLNPVFERGMFFGTWKPLRDDPRFQALVNDPRNNAPLF
jgi:TolB-like protein